jgi:hypothetical protein
MTATTKAKAKPAKAKPAKAKATKRKTGGVASKHAKTEVQSVLFDNKKFTPRQSGSWLHSHGFKQTGVDKTANKLRYRQTSPKKYTKFATKEITPGISFVLGIK